jgi:predicted nuclease with TOPRIM domain
MKCDELIRWQDKDLTEYYEAESVDTAIAELKEFAEDACLERDDNQTAIDELEAENAELKAKLDRAIAERDGNQVCIDALKQKLESVQASMYADVVDANMENRRLRRALWIARAKRAIEKISWFKLWNASISTMNPEDGARQEFDKWKKALGKFLKEAEEYK